MSKWESVKEFVNSNEIFTRKQLITYLDLPKSSNYTETQYLNLMKNCGFIKRIDRGKYQKLIFIPKSLTSSLISSLSYDKERRDEYMKQIERKQKLTNLKNA